MYDTGKILAGLFVFLAIVTSPIWYNVASGKGAYVPKPQLPQGKCIESTEYMKGFHMNMLNTWRNDVIRNGQRVYTAQDGKTWEKSLTKTCMKCHPDRAQFCDQCHLYAGVKTPFCWNCHNEPPKGGQQ